MKIDVTSFHNGDSLTICLSGRFDFSSHKEFRAAYRNTTPGLTFYVDFEEVEYIDSSALGMLLLLQKHASQGDGVGKVIIQSPRKEVKKILDIANFNKLFEIQ